MSYVYRCDRTAERTPDRTADGARSPSGRSGPGARQPDHGRRVGGDPDVLEFHTRITEARFEEEAAHSEYKAAKAKREAIQEELEAFLRSLNRKARDPQQKLPLVEATDDSGRVERGRAIALSTLNLTPGILESLANAGITTVGEAADYATKHDGFRGIPKIGPQKADQIADVIAEFWTRFEAPATESNPPVEQPTPEQTEVIGVEESGGIE